MKIIKEENTWEHENSKNCIAREYDFGLSSIDLATCKITGRYPNTGICYNEKSKELVYVLKGSGVIYVNDIKYPFKEKDAFLINPKEKYYFDANCEIIMVCNPAWSKENHKQEEGEF